MILWMRAGLFLHSFVRSFGRSIDRSFTLSLSISGHCHVLYALCNWLKSESCDFPDDQQH